MNSITEIDISRVLNKLDQDGVLSPKHIELFTNHPAQGTVDGLSILYKYFKIPEIVLVDACNAVYKSEVLKCTTQGGTQSLMEFNRKLLKYESAIAVQVVQDTEEYVIAFSKINQVEVMSLSRKMKVTIQPVLGIPLAIADRALELMLASPNPVKEDTTREDKLFVESMLDLIITDALLADATDIHIEFIWQRELMDYLGVVRFRSNPDIIPWRRHKFSITELAQLKSIICSRAGKNASEANADDGYKFQHNLNYGDYEFRISFQAHTLLRNNKTSKITSNKINDQLGTITGYSCTIRVADTNKLVLTPKELNLGDDIVEELLLAYNTKSGITCITGAPGAGKNTTYAAVVNDPNNREMIVWEAGDPIEYRLPITQINVTDYVHMKSVVRSSKTQDVDKIIVTEFRDSDMGHLIKDTVISNMSVMLTMHISRVWDFVEKYREYFGDRDYKTMVAYTRQICHQVMFKKLCDNCKVPLDYTEMTTQEKQAYEALKLQGHQMYTANRHQDNDCRLQCYGGFMTTRLPAAESLLLTTQDKKAVKLLDALASAENDAVMRGLIKNYMLANKKSIEYKVRERLISGIIDFREAVRLEIYEEVQL